MHSFTNKKSCYPLLAVTFISLLFLLWRYSSSTNFGLSDILKYNTDSSNLDLEPNAILPVMSGNSIMKLRPILGLESNAFFVETSGKPTMKLRALLSVEAAARHLKDLRHLQVYIFVEGDPQKAVKLPVMLALEEHYKVLNFTFVTMSEVAKGTPLQSWYDSEDRIKSPYRLTHSSDGFRFLLTWLNGGVYMDTDIMLINDVTFVNNTLVLEHQKSVGSAFFAFKKGHPFVKRLVYRFVDEYKPFLWGANGPYLLTDQYRICSLEKECDVVLLSTQALWPLRYPDETQYFDEHASTYVLEKIKNSMGFHFGNSYTKDLKLFSNSTSAFATIARKNCPIVWAEVEKVGQA